MSAVRSAIYLSEGAPNLAREAFGGSPDKWAARAYLIEAGSEPVPLLFTARMLDEARSIASRNREDCGRYQAPVQIPAELLRQRAEDLWLVPLMCVASAVLGAFAGWLWSGL